MRLMKTLLFLLVTGALCAAPMSASAATKKKAKASSSRTSETRRQSPASVDQDVSLNVLGALYGTLGITYEKRVGADNSFTVGGDWASRGMAGNTFTILGAHGSYRWWFDQPRALSGWFVGPAAFLYNLSWSYDYPTWNGATWKTTTQTAGGMFFGAGAEGGYQYIFDNHFLLNGGLNLGYLAGGISSNAGGPSLGFGGTYIGLIGSVGYAF